MESGAGSRRSSGVPAGLVAHAKPVAQDKVEEWTLYWEGWLGALDDEE